MNGDGSDPINLTNNLAFEYDAVFSPDGSKIAFTSERDGFGNYEIYVMNSDGSNPTNVTLAPGIDARPVVGRRQSTDWATNFERAMQAGRAG